MNDHDAFITSQMELGLAALATVRTGELEYAYSAAYGGGHILRPASSSAQAAWFHGRSLALALWARRNAAALDLRYAALSQS